MYKLLKENYPFLIVLGVFCSVLSFIVLQYEKFEAHLWINAYYHPFFDYFFYYTTHIVEFHFAPFILLAILLFKNYKQAVLILISFLTTGFITGVLKRKFYDDVRRPTNVIENLRVIPEHFDFTQRVANSFPSGHATAAFAIFCALSIMTNNKKWGYFYAIVACTVAFSRIYLSQHFFEDILAGALIGTIGTFFTYFLLDRFSFGKLSKYSLLGKKKHAN